MSAPAPSAFSWRDLPEGPARVEHPLLRQPLTLIVDDPNPGYNPAYFHLGFRFGPARVPRELISEFADLVEARGIRGKFSVIPIPFGLGRIDRDIDGMTRAEIDYFLDVVRARIAPVLDITPEVLTHWNAIDLPTGNLLPYWEHVWSRSQDRSTLTPYLTLALELLNNVNLPCSGMTSPWDFGDGVELEYAEALLAAQQAVHGRSLTWYFLQMDATSRYVPPQLTILRPSAAEAVVGIACCDTQDFGRGVWWGGEPNPDELIAADGQSGRLAAVLDAGGPGAFHTHWQTMFSQGSRAGLHALGEVVRRIENRFGSQVRWMRCSDLARYAAAAGTVTLEQTSTDAETRGFTVASPFACPEFTLSLDIDRPVRSVFVDGQPLGRVHDAASLAEHRFLADADRLIVCWPLQALQRLTVELA